MSKLPVSEIFGPTIQGEGAVIGLKTMFVRFYGCDYQCSWCDSPFTWNGSEKDKALGLSAEQIVQRLADSGLARCEYVTLSGGNPALYGQPIAHLIHLLHDRGKRIIAETQGSLWQAWLPLIDQLMVSPKPPSSGMQTDWDKLDMILSRIAPDRGSLKVVVFDQQDYQFAKLVHERYPAFPFYVQPGNRAVQDTGAIQNRLLDQLEWLFHQLLADEGMQDVRALPQLHALVWHNARCK